MKTKAIQQKTSFNTLLEFAKKGTLPSLIIKSSDDAIITKTLEGIIISWNPGAEKIYGFTEKEVIGKNIEIIIPKNQHNENDELLKQVRLGQSIPYYETKRIRKDGVIIDVSFALSPIKNKNGKVVGVSVVSRDIIGTPQSSQYARSLIEASLDPLVTISKEGKITDLNEALAKLIGVSRSKLVGTDLFIYFTEPQKAREVYKEISSKGSVTNSPFTLRHKNGKVIDVLFNGSVYKDGSGNILGVVIVARDVTTKKADELIIANKELAFQNQEKEKRADELVIANKELAFQDKEKEKRADELIIANKELLFQNEEKGKRADELIIANKELAFQNEEKEKRANELSIANEELAFQDKEKGKRADELIIANKELVFQNEEKEKRADELIIANKELAFQNEEKEKRANELSIANKELAFQNEEKEKRANELSIANKELAFQDKEKEKRADELIIANKELVFQNEEKEKRADELIIANKELAFQNEEKGKRADELIIANKELVFQNEEKGKRADELIIANKELAFQDQEKGKRADELFIANKELAFQNEEKGKRADELSIANKELAFQNEEKEKRANELSIANKELAFQNEEKGKRADELSIANKELAFQNEEKGKRADELIIANKELVFQNEEKEKRAAELVIADKELAFQNKEKEKRAAELVIADIELDFQNKEKEKREIANKELEAFSYAAKLASQYSLSLIEASRDPLVTISTEGKITDMNQATANITGMTREELKGSDFFDYFTEPQKAREVYQEVFAKGSVADSPLTLRHKDGKLTDVLFNGSVYKDDKGSVLGVVIVARDVTAQKLLSKYSLSLIEASRDPLVTISTEGKITDMNQATVNIIGMSREKLTGTDFFDYFTEPQKAREVYQEVFAKGSVADSPLTLRHNDGKLTDVLFNGSVYKDDRGNVLGVVIVARDVTAQKLLSKYSLSLIEASLDPLVTISIEGKITDMNEATANITGMTREELTGTDFFDYFTEPQKAREVYQEVFAKGSVADSPLTLRHKDGKLTDVLFNGSVYKDDRGNVLGVVIVARDVTDQKRIARELTEAKELAEKLAGAKDQFLASMSHEIRTPLNGIIGFTKILLRNDTTEIQRHQLDAIKTSSDILLVLINDILDLAKIEAGKMNIETTELKLSELINSVLGSFELRFQEKELKINKQYDDGIPKILIGDPVRINQILLNLLSNSVKFTDHGGQISISVNLLTQDKEKTNVEITISDTGIGISPEKLEIIFQPFMQSSNDTARKYGGTGLGLSIVNQLVDLMGGTISVKSQLNKGSAFTISLPLKKSTATEISKDIETKIFTNELKQLGKLKILLAEDIPINQYLAQTILHDFGFETDTAENGKIAIELLEKNYYDIILMDLMMPEMNGFEATQHIRSKMLPPKSTIPIIALTADVTKADVDKCTEIGMNEYVSKPINETDLLNKIALLVNRKK